MRPSNQWLSIPQAGRLLGRSAKSVKRAIDAGSLAVSRLPGTHDKIPASAVAELLAAAHQPAGSAARLRRPKNSDETSVRLAKPVGAA